MADGIQFIMYKFWFAFLPKASLIITLALSASGSCIKESLSLEALNTILVTVVDIDILFAPLSNNVFICTFFFVCWFQMVTARMGREHLKHAFILSWLDT
jgi:hypothetical protein